MTPRSIEHGAPNAAGQVAGSADQGMLQTLNCFVPTPPSRSDDKAIYLIKKGREKATALFGQGLPGRHYLYYRSRAYFYTTNKESTFR
jgi:hypothetical protein